MAGSVLFGLILVLWPCRGQIIPPPGGDRLIFLSGSNATIAWSTRDPDAVTVRSWTFIGNKTRLMALSGVKGANLQYFSSGLDRVKIQGLDTLVLMNVNQSYDGIYRFSITHAITGGHTYDVRVIIAARPVVTLHCSSLIRLNEGDSFTCLCKGKGANPRANVIWYKNGVKLSHVGKEKQTLNLLNVSSIDRGTYKCVATSHLDENYTDEDFIQVIIYFKPMNTVIRFSKNPAVINEMITITCTSEGFPEPMYTIYHNGKVVMTDGTPNTISHVKWKNAGTYKCIAANIFGRDSDYDNLNVTEEPRAPISKTRSTSHSPPSTSTKSPAECNESENADTAESNYSETKWYIIVVILVSGIIIGILLSYIVAYSRRKFKSRKRQHSNPKASTSPVDTTYQELDLTKMNKEDNYQSLRGNATRNDGVNDDQQSNYTELNKTREVENNYQSLT